jgi:hypothetical protein
MQQQDAVSVKFIRQSGGVKQNIREEDRPQGHPITLSAILVPVLPLTHVYDCQL